VRVHNGFDVGTNRINRSVKGKFRRRRMAAIDVSTGANADDVAASQIALIDSCWRNPDITGLVTNRKVAPGRRRHAIAINAIHRLHDCIAGMEQTSYCSHEPRIWVGVNRLIGEFMGNTEVSHALEVYRLLKAMKYVVGVIKSSKSYGAAAREFDEPRF
jgi:hypothetical protein